MALLRDRPPGPFSRARRGLHRRALLAGLAVGVASCGEPAPEPAVVLEDNALVNALETYERPAIGALDLRVGGGVSHCTGTLVTPSVVLAAAHCALYTSEATVGERGTFSVLVSAEERRSFSVRRFWSLGRSEGRDDLALAELASVVDAQVAAPMSLAPRAPPRDARVALYGIGCTDRGDVSTAFPARKRRVNSTFGATTRTGCNGDSGGPMLRDDDVVRVFSSYVRVFGWDRFADVPANHAALLAQIAAWETDGTPRPTSGP